MITNRYSIDIPPSEFSTRLHDTLKDHNLLKLDVVQQDSNQFFFRGYLRFKKEWWNLITQFKYLYLVFDFTIQDENVMVTSNWHEGNADHPIQHQNKSPKVSEELISNENSIHNQIELLITNIN